jgi:8-amino-7-oxononanoate synthase
VPVSPLRSGSLKTTWPKERLEAEGLWHYAPEITGYPSDSTLQLSHGGEMDLLGSYSYLGLLGHPEIQEAAHRAIDHYGTGTHGARLLAGTLSIHKELEQEIAKFIGVEDAVVYSSGYAANLSILSAVMSAGGLIIADRLIHASLVDGCALSGAEVVRFKHSSPQALRMCLEEAEPDRPVLVVIDGIYSMEGDLAPLPEILALVKEFGVSLMVDEAHSIGVAGTTGRGICEQFRVSPHEVDILMGTLSKALPASGGYAAGSKDICDYLRLQSRGFIYSGALSPSVAAAALAALKIIQREPERVWDLRLKTMMFHTLLKEEGIPHRPGESPIVPIMCGTSQQAWEIAAACQKRGVFVQAIVPPVVPEGQARLRAAVNVAHTESQLKRIVKVLRTAFEDVGVPLNEAVGGAK